MNNGVNQSWIIFCIGLFLFGLAYYKIKTITGGGSGFIAIAIVYLICLRYFSDALAKKMGKKNNPDKTKRDKSEVEK